MNTPLNKTKVKVQRCINVGGRKYITAQPAVAEYVCMNVSRLFDKYRDKHCSQHDDGASHWFVLHEKMYRRILPIFKKALGEK